MENIGAEEVWKFLYEALAKIRSLVCESVMVFKILEMEDCSLESCLLKYDLAKDAKPTGDLRSLTPLVSSIGMGGPEALLGFGLVEYLAMVLLIISCNCGGKDGSSDVPVMDVIILSWM